MSALGPSIFSKIRPGLDKAYRGHPSVLEFTDAESARRVRVAFTPDGAGGVYILSLDITEEMQTRVALQQTRRREIAAQLTSGLAHDFSNLLTTILGLQSQLTKRHALPADAKDLAQGIKAAAERGGDLLNRLTDMTVTHGERPKAASVPSLLHNFATLARPSLPESVDLQVTSALPDDHYLLDTGKLQDALLNLVLNARDACGASGEISVHAGAVMNTWLEFKVADTGSGFSETALERAFDPFFSTKGSVGSGLGLSMVYDMVKLAGGDLQIGNTPGGAVVKMRLPLRKALESDGGLVLLVEDSDELRATYREILLDWSYTVIEAASVDEAVALMADLPDIAHVLSDLRLEGSANGVDLVKRIDKQVPAILMTSLPPNDPLATEAAALAPLLHKPFDENDLARLMLPETVQ